MQSGIECIVSKAEANLWRLSFVGSSRALHLYAVCGYVVISHKVIT